MNENFKKMIILEKPYVSDFLIETIKKNNFKGFLWTRKNMTI